MNSSGFRSNRMINCCEEQNPTFSNLQTPTKTNIFHRRRPHPHPTPIPTPPTLLPLISPSPSLLPSSPLSGTLWGHINAIDQLICNLLQLSGLSRSRRFCCHCQGTATGCGAASGGRVDRKLHSLSVGKLQKSARFSTVSAIGYL